MHPPPLPVCSLAAFLLGSLWYLGSDKSASHCRLPRWLLCCSCSQRAWIASNIYGKPPRPQPTSRILILANGKAGRRGFWREGGLKKKTSQWDEWRPEPWNIFHPSFPSARLFRCSVFLQALLLFPLGVSVTQGYLMRPVICCLF